MTWKRLADEMNRALNGVPSKDEAGYVQEQAYLPTVRHQPVLGYFCITCTHFGPKPTGQLLGDCDALETEVAAHGCCNLWKRETNGETDTNTV